MPQDPISEPAGSTADSAPTSQKIRANLSTRWALTLAAALLAGLVSWALGEWAVVHFAPRPEEILREAHRSGSTWHATVKLERVALMRSSLVSYGSLGALLGFALGLCGGRTLRSNVMAASSGLVVGGLGAMAGAWLFLPIHFRDVDFALANTIERGLVVPLTVHAGMWVPIGLAAGLALGISLGGVARTIRTVVGGALGAAVGTVVYDLVGSLTFSAGPTAEPIPTTLWLRLIAHVGIALFATAGALTIAFHLNPRRSPGKEAHVAR
jgi:hypothetical protein